jgi:hypothetical protein
MHLELLLMVYELVVHKMTENAVISICLFKASFSFPQPPLWSSG